MHWTSPKGGKVYAGFHIELEGIKKFTCQKGLSNVTLTLRLRFFCRLLFQLMFSLSLASLSIFIVKSFFNHAYALVFISLVVCHASANPGSWERRFFYNFDLDEKYGRVQRITTQPHCHALSISMPITIHTSHLRFLSA